MKKYSLFLLCLMAAISLHAQSFADYFADKTLRVDYIFTGNAAKQEICLDGLSCLPSWAGRKHHLSELPLQGNGQIIMRDAANGSVIYKTSFSSLFQEWLETDEAKAVTKGFENTFLLPYPLRPAEIEITLLDPRRNVRASMKHTVSPDDILIHQKGTAHITPHKYLLQSGNTAKCIDVHEKALQHCSSGQPLRRQRSKRTTPRRMETDSIQLSFQHILFRPVSDNLPCQIHTRCAGGNTV